MAQNPSLMQRPRRFYIAIAIGAVVGTAIGMAIKGEIFSLTSFIGTALGLGLGFAIHSTFIANLSDGNSPSASGKNSGSSKST